MYERPRPSRGPACAKLTCRGVSRLNGFEMKSHLLLPLNAFNRSVTNSGFAKLASSATRVKVRVFAAHSRRVAPAEAKVL